MVEFPSPETSRHPSSTSLSSTATGRGTGKRFYEEGGEVGGRGWDERDPFGEAVGFVPELSVDSQVVGSTTLVSGQVD